jgi:hypothetical protein
VVADLRLDERPVGAPVDEQNGFADRKAVDHALGLVPGTVTGRYFGPKTTIRTIAATATIALTRLPAALRPASVRS